MINTQNNAYCLANIVSDDEDDLVDIDTAFFERQRAEELRIQCEKEDVALAQRMNRASVEPSVRPLATASMPSAFDIMSGLRPQPSNSTSATATSTATLGHVSTNSSEKRIGTPGGTTREAGSLASDMSTGSASATSPIPRLKTGALLPMPGAFQVSPVSDDDSDIEILSAAEFRRPGISPAARLPATNQTNHSSTNSALRLATYGAKPLPSWMNGPNADTKPNSFTSLPRTSLEILNTLYQPQLVFTSLEVTALAILLLDTIDILATLDTT